MASASAPPYPPGRQGPPAALPAPRARALPPAPSSAGTGDDEPNDATLPGGIQRVAPAGAGGPGGDPAAGAGYPGQQPSYQGQQPGGAAGFDPSGSTVALPQRQEGGYTGQRPPAGYFDQQAS